MNEVRPDDIAVLSAPFIGDLSEGLAGLQMEYSGTGVVLEPFDGQIYVAWTELYEHYQISHEEALHFA